MLALLLQLATIVLLLAVLAGLLAFPFIVWRISRRRIKAERELEQRRLEWSLLNRAKRSPEM